MADPEHTLGVLLELTRKLTEDISLEDALGQVTEACLKLLAGDHVSVRVFDDSGTQLLCGARAGVGKQARPLDFQRGEGVVGWVADQGLTARIEDVAADERFKQVEGQGWDIRSILAFPLWASGQVVGVLSMSSAETGAFSEEHETLGLLLANCAVPPIERARLHRLALTDNHTRAYNQRYLFPRLREEIEKARRYVTPLSLLLLDLDYLKGINDRYGHAAGDAALRVFADRVRQTVRRPDVLVRRGGDEFVLIMPHTNRIEAELVANRIRASMEQEPIEEAGESFTQTVSVGVASWNGAESAEELEQRVDAALYSAKEAGRNAVAIA